MEQDELVGLGLYTPAEAADLTNIPARRITRWLSGHRAGGKRYEPLWTPQVRLASGGVHLGFLDILEIRVTDALIASGLSAQSVRRAIRLARDELHLSHPLASHRFSVDGKRLILSVVDPDGTERSLDLLNRQYVLRRLVERSLKDVDFEDSQPLRWWPKGRAAGIVVDPARSFGRAIEDTTGVPVEILSRAVDAEGSPEAAARAYEVPLKAVRRARAFCFPIEREAA